jgi:hypothetical protein
MLEGLQSFAFVAVATLVVGLPVFLVARRQRRADTIRNFLLGAGVIALLCGTMEYVSIRQVNQCLNAGNTDCVDAGTIGMQMVFVAGYAIAAWITAFSMHRS